MIKDGGMIAGIVHDIAVWMRDALGWIVVALAGGTLFALRHNKVGVREWVAVLIKSVIVGVLAAAVVEDTALPPGWKWALVAAIAFGADAILYVLDQVWARVANNPWGLIQNLIKRLLFGRDDRGDGP